MTSTVIIVAALFSLASATTVTLHKFEDCEANADYPIKMSFKLKEDNGKQIIEDAKVSSKVPIGNNIQDIAEVYSKEDNGNYDHLITISENICDAINKFMGDFMHDMQEAAGLQRGQCPIPAGDYQIKDHPLDFSRFKFKKIPDGAFKVKVNLVDTANNATLNCHIVEFSIAK